MRAAAADRGITITSRSRPLTPGDIDEFDLLICMVRFKGYFFKQENQTHPTIASS